MAEDQIRYDILAQDALRGVVRKVLSEVARTGLPGEHHFFITFVTQAPGVRVSSRLLARYAEEMTIVIQHQYWDLAVTEHAFDVGLSFNGVPERLHVPFTAVKAFVDPSVQFALQFQIAAPAGQAPGEHPREMESDQDTGAEDAAARPAAEPVPLPAPVAEAPAAEAPTAGGPASDDDAEEERAGGEAQVVSLDAFRKKS